MVFLLVLIGLLIILVIIVTSKIRFQIKDFEYSLINMQHVNPKYKIQISWFIFGKIPIVRIDIDKTKINKLKIKEKITNIETEIIQGKKPINKNILKVIKKIKLDVKELNLKIDLGTENASFTSIIIPILSTIISMLLRNRIKDYKNQHYIVNPIFTNQNLINIELSSIFEIKMIHIIDSIYVLNKKEGVDKYERTSNRRAYDNCYE